MISLISRFAIPIFASALFAIGSAWYVERNINKQLELQIAEVNQRFEQVNKELKNAMQAADSAIRAKNEIYAMAAQKQIDLENSLKLSPDFDNMLIPDDLRLLLEATETNDDKVSASRSIDGRHTNSVKK